MRMRRFFEDALEDMPDIGGVEVRTIAACREHDRRHRLAFLQDGALTGATVPPSHTARRRSVPV
jgi:hypothetical protein